MPDIRGILFDLDGTLIDRDKAAARYWRSVLPKDHALIKKVLRADNGGPGCLSRTMTSLRTAGRLDPAARARIRASFTLRIASHLTPEPDVRLLMDRLAARYKLGVLTNGKSATQRAKLVACGLEDAFTAVIISEEVGVRKPAARIFRIAAERLDVPPAQLLIVGDDLTCDIRGGKAAGLRTCWRSGASPTPSAHPANHRIRHLLELEDVLTCLTRVR